MNKPTTNRKGYLLSAALGAMGGGLFVLVATRAVPRIMSQMMCGMITQMAGEGCDPADL